MEMRKVPPTHILIEDWISQSIREKYHKIILTTLGESTFMF